MVMLRDWWGPEEGLKIKSRVFNNFIKMPKEPQLLLVVHNGLVVLIYAQYSRHKHLNLCSKYIKDAVDKAGKNPHSSCAVHLLHARSIRRIGYATLPYILSFQEGRRFQLLLDQLNLANNNKPSQMEADQRPFWRAALDAGVANAR